MQPEHLLFALVLSVAVVASVLGAVVGYGAAIMMLPALAAAVGPARAVPILSMAAVLAVVARVWGNWSSIEWSFASRYIAAAVPLTAVGALLFSRIPPTVLGVGAGVTTVAVVALRRLLPGGGLRLRRQYVPLLGATVGLFSGLGAVVGPAEAPIWLSYGLTGTAFVGTMSLTALVMQALKSVIYASSLSVARADFLLALTVGVVMLAGSIAGKRLAERVSNRAFVVLVEAVSIASGVWLICSSLQS